VMALAVAIESNVPYESVELDVNWKDTKPRNEKESWEIAQIKSALGVSREQILREQGYTDEQIEQFQTDAAASGVVSSETMSRTGQILERIAASEANGTTPRE
jgi:hypothetical protein